METTFAVAALGFAGTTVLAMVAWIRERAHGDAARRQLTELAAEYQEKRVEVKRLHAELRESLIGDVLADIEAGGRSGSVQ